MLTTEQALEIARELAERWAWRMETRQPEPNRLDIVLPAPSELVPFAVVLRVQRLGYLAAITALDAGPQAGQLELLYHFTYGAAVITLRLVVPRQGAAVPTLTEIIASAESSEREIAEMFGVTFDGLRRAEPLYLPEDWPSGVFPLRKDAVLPAGDG